MTPEAVAQYNINCPATSHLVWHTGAGAAALEIPRGRLVEVELNVAQLLKEPVGSTRLCRLDEAGQTHEGASRASGDLLLTRTNRGILVQGTLRAQAEVTCGRCLEACTISLRVEFEEEYYPTVDVLTGARLPLPEGGESTPIDEHHQLDLTEAVAQYVSLALPMKPLCREDCAGLCPVCGHNLNEGDCGCLRDGPDHRWAALRDLLVRPDR